MVGLTNTLSELIGPTLQGKDGNVETSSLTSKVTGIYFSAHWCPPCRGFTPKLSEAYKKLKANGKDIEIVFASSDKDEAAFDDYFSEMPWLAIPFSDRARKAALSKKFKVSGIPTLVLVDQNGELITKDGCSAIMEDPEGTEFPWTPKTFAESLGNTFIGQNAASVGLEAIQGRTLGIYFSAHWCPPCRGFTPKLVDTYKKARAAGNDFEVVFVSSDKDQAAFDEYFAEMPWLAIPHGDTRKDALNKFFEVEGIPTLVIVEADTGRVINSDGRSAVDSDPEAAEFPWKPKPVNDLNENPAMLNEEPCVCILMDGEMENKPTVATALDEVAREHVAAAEMSGKPQELYFYTAVEEGGVVDQVRRLTSIGKPTSTPVLLLLDIPDDGGFYVSTASDITQDVLRDFIAKYKAGSLERKQLAK
jgi:nucleoredoxin